MGATRRALVPLLGPLKTYNWSDLAGDEGGRCGGWAREAGKGGEMGGGAPEESGSALAGDEEGRGGGGGPGRRARRGRWGGGTREQCGSNKACTGSTFWGSLPTIGLIWLVTRG